jgi:hypothetical protein
MIMITEYIRRIPATRKPKLNIYRVVIFMDLFFEVGCRIAF